MGVKGKMPKRPIHLQKNHNSNGFQNRPHDINRKGGQLPSQVKNLEALIKREFKVRINRKDKLQILESMLEMSLMELRVIATDPNCPVFMVTVAKAIKTDIGLGRTNTLNMLMDRFFGKTVTSIQHSGSIDGETKEIRVLRLEYSADDIDVDIITSEAEMEARFADYELLEEDEARDADQYEDDDELGDLF